MTTSTQTVDPIANALAAHAANKHDYLGNECITIAEARARGGLRTVRTDEWCLRTVRALTFAGFRAYREDNTLHYFFTDATDEQIAAVAA